MLKEHQCIVSDWITKLDEFLVLNEKEILRDRGSVSRRDMEVKVRAELDKYKNRMEEKVLLESTTERVNNKESEP
ncbi:MAG: hypothetical protein EF812_04650 [Methanosarcinales archaeon]|nr:MAG: hypothetical protein EF812_04650 [Methanosarcinales archaeon]